MITPEMLINALRYDPITGIVRRVSNNRVLLTPKACFMGTHIQTSHIAWVLHYGRWPNDEIDHINHDRSDNRIENLRECSRASNMHNRRWKNPNGKGVTHRPERRDGRHWQAQIQANKRKIQLGFFSTKEEAAEAYRQAALKYHGEFACLE